MRYAVPPRALALTLTLLLAACGSSAKSPDGAAGASGTDGGGAAGGDGGLAGSDAGATGGAAGGASGTAGGAAGFGEGGMEMVFDAGNGPFDSGPGDGPHLDVATASEGGEADAGAGDADAAVEVALVGSCPAIALYQPAAAVTNIASGKAIDVAAFTGGTLESGTYLLTSVSHFGGTYAGATQEILSVDAAAKTIGDSYILGSADCQVFSYTVATATTLVVTPTSGGAQPLTDYYSFVGTGSGATLSVNAAGSSDVKVFTKQ
jgi:hypothetical protein